MTYANLPHRWSPRWRRISSFILGLPCHLSVLAHGEISSCGLLSVISKSNGGEQLGGIEWGDHFERGRIDSEGYSARSNAFILNLMERTLKPSVCCLRFPANFWQPLSGSEMKVED